MIPHPDRRPAATGVGPASLAIVLLALVALLAACGGGSAPSTPPSDAPGSPAPSADPATPGPATDVATVIGSADDGQTVTVEAFFLAQDGVAQLCDLVLESYPPQCGGSIVRLTGQVPQAVLDELDSTSEPDLAQATWGEVRVSGTYRTAGADGQPTIELTSIEVVAPGA